MRRAVMTRASFASIGLMLGVCGCGAIAPPPDAGGAVDVPATWSASTTAAAPTTSTLIEWWSRFDDPLLARLVAQALQFNTSVTGARAALRQARAARDVAAAGLVPTLDGSGSAQRSSAGSGATRITGSIFQAGVDANWELDIFGARRSALDAAEAVARASEASLGDVRVSIAAEVALAYIALRGTQARLAIARDNLASQQETLQITLWRQQAGLVTAVEAEQARTATQQTSALVPALQTSIDRSRHALAVLTGKPPAALSAVLAADGPVPQAADDVALTIPAETLRQRADVRAAEHQVTAALARVAQADAARWPSFNIGGSLGLKSATLGSLAERASFVGSLLADLSMPLFDGGAARAQVRAQQAALDQARSSYQAAVFTALTDVEDALVALRGDRERLTHLQRAAESAGDAALLARQRYASGLIDFQTVLETQRTQLSTQDSVASVRADLGADHVRLYKALGGGWDPNAGAAASSTRVDTPRTEPS
jgi:multidrug efflux system outer membrane protein